MQWSCQERSGGNLVSWLLYTGSERKMPERNLKFQSEFMAVKIQVWRGVLKWMSEWMNEWMKEWMNEWMNETLTLLNTPLKDFSAVSQLTVKCTSHFKPPHPPFGLERGIHFLCKWKWVKSAVPEDKSEWYIPPPLLSIHGTTLVKQLIIAKRNTVASHEINRLILERPANNPLGDAKTVTWSEFPASRGTKMKCLWGESSCNPPLRPEWGGGGLQMTGA